MTGMTGYGSIVQGILISNDFVAGFGPAHSENQGMAYHVLLNTGNIVTRSTVVLLSKDELTNDTNKQRMTNFTSEMEKIIGNYSHSTSKLIEYKNDDPDNNIIIDDELTDDEFQYLEANNLPSRDNFLAAPEDNHHSVNATDKLLGMRLQLPHKG